MEEEFIVESLREGTTRISNDMEHTISNIGSKCFQNRDLGDVIVEVERLNGIINKQIIWGETNSRRFNENLNSDVERLLNQSVRAVEGSGDDNGVRIKMVAKI